MATPTTLLPDYATVLADANRHAVAVVEGELALVKDLEEHARRLAELGSIADTLRRRVARRTRAETQEAVARCEEAEELWAATVATLGQRPPTEAQVQVLEMATGVIRSGREFAAAVAGLWVTAAKLGWLEERSEDLDRVAARFERLLAEATRALDARRTPWQPADPERLARGVREAAEGKAVGPDEARGWFRPANG